MPRTKKVEKTGSVDVSASRWPMGAIGFEGLYSIQGQILEEARKELRWPDSVRTYQRMSYDPIIGGSNNLIDTMINKVPWTFKAPKNASAEVERATEFLNWCMNNMEGQTWMDFIGEVGSYRIYGYHVAEKVMKSVNYGKWKGKFKWKKLATRSQGTIREWLWSDDKRELKGIRQDLSRVTADARFRFTEKTPTDMTNIVIPRNKFMLFRYGAKKDNPEGHSPLIKCYIPWKEKQIIENYELIGIGKDLSGVVKIGVDVNYMNKAAANPAGIEARNIEEMKRQAADLHAGEKSFVVVPIATDQNGNKLFEFSLMGIEGTGKQFDTDIIIRRKQGEILMAYLTDVLRLGSESHGSFSLADAKTSLLGHSIEYHLGIIADVINTDLVPQTLALNGWFFEDEEMPKITFGDIETVDLDVLSKFIQRVVSVGAISVDKELDKSLREQAKLPVPEYKDPIPKEFVPSTGSKAGEGMKTAGPGTSKSPLGGDKSVANNENAMTKSTLPEHILKQIEEEMNE